MIENLMKVIHFPSNEKNIFKFNLNKYFRNEFRRSKIKNLHSMEYEKKILTINEFF